MQLLLAVDSRNGSLTGALRALVERLERVGAPAIDLQLPEILRHLPPNLTEVLFRTAQEALHNALKHANATRIGVSLTQRGTNLELRVHDDGVGLAAETAVVDVDLRTMRRRVEQVGGRLRPGTDAGSGTGIVLELPVPSAGAALQEPTSPIGTARDRFGCRAMGPARRVQSIALKFTLSDVVAGCPSARGTLRR